MTSRPINMAGQRFGALTAIEVVGRKDEAGILRSTFLLRLKAGVSGAALLAPSKQEGCLTFNGITDTYAGWAQRTGIKTSTIAMRVTSYGWPVHKALTQGASL